MRWVVVDLSSSRPIWSIPSESVAVIGKAFGTGWKVVQVTSPTSSDGDGAGGTLEAIRAATGAEIYFGWGIPSEVIRAAAGSLRWVHTAAGGVGASLTPELRTSGALLTNSRGIHADPIAEWVIAAIGFCQRGFHAAVAAQTERWWAKDTFTDGTTRLGEFTGLRVGLVGLGGIGRAVARRCAALGMLVRAVRRRPLRRRPAGVMWVGGADDLLRLASESDVLVIAAPHTSETVRLVDDSVFTALPRGAYVINVARGALLDEEALLTHLTSGHLAGCVLDVFTVEPLPVDHPFWSHPKVFLTPHVSAVSHRFWERETSLLVENIGRYLAERSLKNLVDLKVGY